MLLLCEYNQYFITLIIIFDLILFQVIFDNNKQSTTAKGMFPVSTSTLLYDVDEVEVRDSSPIGFATRTTAQGKLSPSFGKITGTKDVKVYVNSNIQLAIGGTSKEMKLKVSIHVFQGGILKLPETTIVEKSVQLELCGTLTGVKTLIVRNSGTDFYLNGGFFFFKK